MRKVTGVLGITSSNFPLPGYLGNYWPVQVEGSDKLNIFHAGVAANFFNVLHIPVRNQLGELREDTSSAADYAVVNEEAVKRFNIGDRIVGKQYKLGENNVEVAGIMNNFHVGSLRDMIQPIQFTIFEKGWNNIIRTGGDKPVKRSLQKSGRYGRNLKRKDHSNTILLMI